MKELREYQSRIVNAVLDSAKNLIICSPTGSGKTAMASAILDAIAKNGDTGVFIVPRLELINQAADEFNDADRIWADRTSLSGKHIIIASKDSLKSQWTKIRDVPNLVLIFDECHVGIMSTHTIVSNLKPKRVLGLTATPERMDGLALVRGEGKRHRYGVFDDLLQIESVPSLIDKRYLAPLRYYTKPIMGITDVKPAKGGDAKELSGEQMTEIFDSCAIWGNLVYCYEKYATNPDGSRRPAIGFTTTIAMGEQVVALFRDAGYKFEIIHGEMPIEKRNALLDELRSRELDGLVNAELLTYGFDCPPVSYAFSCRHIKSRPLWFQIVGRILRPSPETGKTDAIFVDHGDSISEFSEKDCALPILSRHVNWRFDGEDTETKKARKREAKKTQNVLRELLELDPIPCEMVEVTTEDNFDRLLRILADMRSKKEALEQEKIELTRTNIQLEKELTVAKKNGPVKTVSTPQTREYVKTRYCKTRRFIEDMNPSITAARAHAETRSRLLKDAGSLPFLLDTIDFDRSLSWWQHHYSHDFNVEEWKKKKMSRGNWESAGSHFGNTKD